MLDRLFNTAANKPMDLLITSHQLDQGWESFLSVTHQSSQLLASLCCPLADLGATGCKPAALPPWWAAVQALCNTGLDLEQKVKGDNSAAFSCTWPFHTVAGTSESQKGVICCLKSGQSTVKLLLAVCACEFSSSPCVSKVLLLPTQL